MDPELRNRLIAGAAVALVAVFGVSRSGQAGRGGTARLAEIQAGAKTAELAQAEALAREFEHANTARHFTAELNKDAEVYGLANVDVESLRQPNAFEQLVESVAPVTVAVNRTHRTGPLKIKAVNEKVQYLKGGATIRAQHAIARVENVGKKPVAYFIDVRSSDRGECEVKGSRRHNAMALMPGEAADLVVCGGRGGVEILDLRVLEITPMGYVYLSKLPPQTIGLEPARAQAHVGPRGANRCASVPSARISSAIDAGEYGWADVADFYSRHNCDRLQIPPGYRRAEAPVETLPVTAGTADG